MIGRIDGGHGANWLVYMLNKVSRNLSCITRQSQTTATGVTEKHPRPASSTVSLSTLTLVAVLIAQSRSKHPLRLVIIEPNIMIQC